MNPELALVGTAAVIGFLHTLFGPDHYVPFVAMARVGRWSLRKTVVVTVLCGLGHVLSSILLGCVGIAGGVLLLRLEHLESLRGEVAGWMLLGFGLAYFLWGLVQAIRNVPHVHLHAHGDGTIHEHLHTHQGGHLHVHSHVRSDASTEVAPDAAPTGTSLASQDQPGHAESARQMTPWILFTIFLFGPCEPLIPMLMYPAAEANLSVVLAVSAVFALVTISTMTAAVVSLHLGASLFRGHAIHRFGHAVAGLAIIACGVAIKLGL